MDEQMKYLKILAKTFPNAAATVTEIVNLEAILNLPKGTEHFVSDLHGEYEAFQHITKNGSGNIKEKIKELFSNRLSAEEMNTLATIIYYPKEKLSLIMNELDNKNEQDQFLRTTISLLIEICVFSASKYTQSKVRKALPKEFSYIIEELLSKDSHFLNKEDYYDEIITSLIHLDQAEDFIAAISTVIQRLVVDHLHVLGDVYDRGPYPDKIIDLLMTHHSLDITWGNHDILWIGAASGSKACIINALRISTRYGNLETIEDAYGVSLRHLLTFAETTYPSHKETTFTPRIDEDREDSYDEENMQLSKIQQALAVIQFKLEAHIICRNKDFNMEDRVLLNQIDYEKNIITIDGNEYPLQNVEFPTIDPKNPLKLTEEEETVVNRLVDAFMSSDRLKKHINFLISKGSMYLVYNENLLYHGCVPLNEDGSLMEMELDGVKYKGKALFDYFDRAVRSGFINRKKKENQRNLDLIWYLWTGPISPLFGKQKMTTFERYYIKDRSLHKEEKNAYYKLREEEKTVCRILKEFDAGSQDGRIINGHTPVKERKGEDPIKANGRLFVIDGGYSKPYQKTTGLGGYTLLYNSYGLQLVSHQPFTSRKDAILNESDIVSTRRIVDREVKRKKVAQTDIGKNLSQQIEVLKELLEAYQLGKIKENH